MSTEADLFTALRTLVSNRVYPDTFIQPNGSLPDWPAIRYELISVVPNIALCGDDGDDAPDTRVQLDLVEKTKLALLALRLQVFPIMKLFTPPAVYQDTFYSYDSDTKTYRAAMDYIIYKSSPAGSP